MNATTIEVRLQALEDQVRHLTQPLAAQPAAPFNLVRRAKELAANAALITVKEIEGRCRAEHIAWARFVAIHLIRSLGGLSTTQIGKAFGRDHTTIIHALRAVTDHRETSPSFALALERLESELLAEIKQQKAA
jgi:chromosomal replication initiator protein